MIGKLADGRYFVRYKVFGEIKETVFKDYWEADKFESKQEEAKRKYVISMLCKYGNDVFERKAEGLPLIVKERK